MSQIVNDGVTPGGVIVLTAEEKADAAAKKATRLPAFLSSPPSERFLSKIGKHGVSQRRSFP
jgi:hypothetical protein